MSNSQYIDDIINAITSDNTGLEAIVGAILCAEVDQELMLKWHKEGLFIFDVNKRSASSIKVRHSVFRSILARIAQICNENTSANISQYGGCAYLGSPRNPAIVLRIKFQNTSTNQSLYLTSHKKRIFGGISNWFKKMAEQLKSLKLQSDAAISEEISKH